MNKLVRHTVQPAGRIKRIAAALLVDDAVQVEQKNNQRIATRRRRSPDEMKQIEELAAAALGIDAKRGDVLAVENLSFQSLQQEAPVVPTWMERVQHSLRDWAWIFRYLALGCLFGSVYMLLLRPVKKQLLTAMRELALHGKTTAAETSAAAVSQLPEALDLAGLEGDPSLKKLTLLKNHLVEKVKTEPVGASRLVQNWLREGGVE